MALSGVGVAQEVGAPQRKGVNLNSVIDFSSEIPFVDVFRQARPWIPQLADSSQPWNTGAPLATTPEGWPLLAPGQAAGTLIFPEIEAKYPAGVYTLLFEGQGNFQFGGNVQVLSQQPGRWELSMTPTNGGIYLKLVASDPLDPVRDIRLILPGHEATYQSAPFNPDFLASLAHYDVVRFMMWQQTNFSNLAEWSQRPLVSDAFQTSPKGVAFEHMVALANELGFDPWFCVPYLASDDFVTQFATLLRDTLDPSLRIYLEYSNEVWNTIFPGGVHARQQGLAEGLSTDPYQAQLFWYSKRAVEIFEIFRTVFGEEADTRLVRVLAAHSANPWSAQQVLDFQAAYTKADAYGLAPYFAANLGYPIWPPDGSILPPPAVSMTVDEILDECEDQILNKVLGWIQATAAITSARGIEMIAYEAGQRMAGEFGWENNQELTDKFLAVNRHPRMYELYWLYTEVWRQLGGTLMLHYVSCRTFNKWGAYGLLENQTIPASEAPKYRAVRDQVLASQLVERFGTACGGLQARFQGAPLVGSGDLRLRLAGAPAGAPALLALGASRDLYAGVALPVLFGFDAPGCALWVSPDLLWAAAADGQGRAEVALPIPALPILAGQFLYTQWAAADPGANPLGLILSDALALQVAEEP